MRFLRVICRLHVPGHHARPTPAYAAGRPLRVSPVRVRVVQAPRSRELDDSCGRTGHADIDRHADDQMAVRQGRDPDGRTPGGEVLLVRVHRRRGHVRPRNDRRLRRVRV